jgi:hypothetical protein
VRRLRDTAIVKPLSSDALLTSLVRPINFVSTLNFVGAFNERARQVDWRQIVDRVPDQPGRNHPGQIRRHGRLRGTTRQAPSKIKGEPWILFPPRRTRDFGRGLQKYLFDARETPHLAGDHTARDHPFPSRTRKLSLAGPMVLHGQPCGRLGDRRH